MDVGFLDLGKKFEGVAPHERILASLELARAAETAGARRYWLAEHHVPDVALHAPEVVLALAASATESIRIGSAGVLLRYYSPLKVWETYLTLAAAFGNRIDLGLVRGPGVVDPAVANELVSGNAAELAPEAFDAKVRELHRLSQAGHAARGLGGEAAAPTMWMLGSGATSAVMARELNLPYGYMCFVPRALDEAARTLALVEPRRRRVVLAVSVAAGATSAEGHAISERCVSRGFLRANVSGSVADCREQVLNLTKSCAPDEVVLACLSPRHEDQTAAIAVVAALAEGGRGFA